MNTRLLAHIRDGVFLGTLLIIAGLTMLTSNRGIVRSMQAGALETTAWLEARYARVAQNFNAISENSALREENIRLSSQIARSREVLVENERLRHLIGYRNEATYNLLPARIINKDITGQWNYLTLDVGEVDSVATHMAVINERGIIGYTILVSKHYSKVIPYVNTEVHISAKIHPLQASGIIRWDGVRTDRLHLDSIVKTEPVETGQSVVTAGYSSIFPAGLPIGSIDSISVRPGRYELTIFVRPAASISTAEHVFVVRERPDPERIEFEQQDIR